MSQMKLSVIIPVYNGARFLAGAVRSVLRQNYQPTEIIIVDDGSDDATPQIARALDGDARYIRQENAGPAAARNTGIGAAQGELIAFLDVDDLWAADKLRRQASALDEQRTVDVVCGRVQCMRLVAQVAGDAESHFENYAEPKIGFNLGSALFRRRVFEQVGLFDPTLRFSEDVDWFVRARELNVSILVLNEVALYYRRHLENMTYAKTIYDFNFMDVLKQSLDRRRRDASVASPLSKLNIADSESQKLP